MKNGRTRQHSCKRELGGPGRGGKIQMLQGDDRQISKGKTMNEADE